MDAIFVRRSVRKFTTEKVLPPALDYMLKAAMAAPSAGNQQPWEFVVIDDRAVLDKIPSVHPYAEMLKQSPLAILVCGDLTREKRKGFWIQDCAAATQNLLLAATTLGLGSVWLGVYPREDRVEGLRALLNLPEHIVPFALVPVGEPDEHKPPSDRYDATRVHKNKW